MGAIVSSGSVCTLTLASAVFAKTIKHSFGTELKLSRPGRNCVSLLFQRAGKIML